MLILLAMYNAVTVWLYGDCRELASDVQLLSVRFKHHKTLLVK